jgi:aminoglycoside 6'-N-acetyltransferase I
MQTELNYLVQEFELYRDDSEDRYTAYFDKRDGKVHGFEDRFLGYAEDGETPNNLTARELECGEDAKAFLDSFDEDALVPLPGKYDFREYDVMEEFGELQANSDNAGKILDAIRGNGAFRKFRAAVERLGLLKEWYAYRDRAFRDFVMSWCDRYGIDYIPKREVFTYRPVASSDIEIVTELLAKLYYKSKRKIQEHRAELRAENETLLVSNSDALFLAYSGETAIGVAHVSLRREYVEGTDGGAVGYLEAIFVEPGYRMQGIARYLLGECRKWAIANDCDDFASDCEINNEASYRFHMKTGFEEASRNIHFTMPLFRFGLYDDEGDDT